MYSQEYNIIVCDGTMTMLILFSFPPPNVVCKNYCTVTNSYLVLYCMILFYIILWWGIFYNVHKNLTLLLQIQVILFYVVCRLTFSVPCLTSKYLAIVEKYLGYYPFVHHYNKLRAFHLDYFSSAVLSTHQFLLTLRLLMLLIRSS